MVHYKRLGNQMTATIRLDSPTVEAETSEVLGLIAKAISDPTAQDLEDENSPFELAIDVGLDSIHNDLDRFCENIRADARKNPDHYENYTHADFIQDFYESEN